MIQRPVADLSIEGEWALFLISVKKERPQYSCNFVKCVKASKTLNGERVAKKFAPEIKVPAQKNQLCVVSLTNSRD